MAAPYDAPPAPVAARPPPPTATTPCSALVARLIGPRLDPARHRIRLHLLRLSDEQLRTGLGLSAADIVSLRAAAVAAALLEAEARAEAGRPDVTAAAFAD